jgi:hypothetical protein
MQIKVAACTHVMRTVTSPDTVPQHLRVAFSAVAAVRIGKGTD